MKLRILLITFALLVPLSAQATHIEGVTAMGDCNGWQLDTEIFWRSTVFEGDLSYTVELLDANNNVLETQTGTGTVTRASNPQTYVMDGMWTVTAPGGLYYVNYTVNIHVEVGGEVIDDETSGGTAPFDCASVAEETSNWSNVKALYR